MTVWCHGVFQRGSLSISSYMMKIHTYIHTYITNHCGNLFAQVYKQLFAFVLKMTLFLVKHHHHHDLFRLELHTYGFSV